MRAGRWNNAGRGIAVLGSILVIVSIFQPWMRLHTGELFVSNRPEDLGPLDLSVGFLWDVENGREQPRVWIFLAVAAAAITLVACVRRAWLLAPVMGIGVGILVARLMRTVSEINQDAYRSAGAPPGVDITVASNRYGLVIAGAGAGFAVLAGALELALRLRETRVRAISPST